MKPEAGQWWQMKDDAETRCFIVGECRNGNYIIEWKDGEYSEDNMEDWEHIPDCDDFNWKEPETVNDELKEQVAAFIGNYYGDQCEEYEQDCIICSKWKAFRELFELPEPPKPEPEPQPAEDPDEWVIQDRVPIRVQIDRCWYMDGECGLPADPEDMWQKYNKDQFLDGKKHGDYVRDGGGTLHVMCRRRDLPKDEQAKTDAGHDWSYHEKQQPQPKKTMLRLWIDSDCNIHAGLKNDSDLELHYDHETRQFYTEETR